MRLQKNEIYRVKITDLSFEAFGIGKVNGMVVFVANAVIGDELMVQIVKVLRNYAYGIIREIVAPSPDRVQPSCAVSSKCGGCSLQAMTYQSECRFKWKRVNDCMKRIGGTSCPVSPLIPAEQIQHYRNKAQYPVAKQNGKIVSGFYAPRSHHVIASEYCQLHPPIFSEILEAFLEFLEMYGIEPYQPDTGKGTIRHLYLRQSSLDCSILVCVVSSVAGFPFEEKLAPFLIERFSEIIGIVVNWHPEKNNVILGKDNRLLYGTGELEDVLAGVRLRLSPNSFYQVNHAQTEKLYQIAKQFALTASANDVLLDLYCGVGSIGLSMADCFHRVIGVESVSEAIENAKYNAKMNQIDSAEFYCMDATQAAQRCLTQQVHPDVVILDPPRKGCSPDVIVSVAKMEPKRIVMISCNPATCARDLAAFQLQGYVEEKIVPVDLFPRTIHVETVVQLVRKKPDTYIDITVDMDELDLTSSEAKATYDEIKDYIFDKHRVKVSSLYVAQVKQKHGIIERDCYNNSKKDNPKQPQCPPEKVKLIEEALRHFKMIP